jgi:hypothetical protein
VLDQREQRRRMRRLQPNAAIDCGWKVPLGVPYPSRPVETGQLQRIAPAPSFAPAVYMLGSGHRVTS